MDLLVSALEPSSNIHLEEILKHNNHFDIKGIFDERFGTPIVPSKEFSVMGIIDVIPKILKAKQAIKKLAKLSLVCDKVLLIDAPAFNIPLARAIKKINPEIKIIYYILPKVWVWRKSRVKKVEKYCDEICSIFPFENKYYKTSKYVGNPLLDIIDSEKDIEESGNVAFLAGSRKSEIKSLITIFKETAKKIDKQPIIVVPKHLSQEEIDDLYGDLSKFKICYDTKVALMQSDFAFVCSGTASLETALLGVPSVIVYKAKKLDYMVAKFIIKLKFMGLANIIFDYEGLTPLQDELVQSQVNPEILLEKYNNRVSIKDFQKDSSTLREILHSGSANNISAIIRD
ncbi:MAG: Lipid-A-disaccharide synthase (EC [uncultured Campylobacterales bacterium]|uniref:Lipid-A-disaccharide synthase n=1 Tax=uncultured Campylobacterales bacterium TaxID=352960 RepID=A0A6S6S795_9BACT|nr:MAG: Lipid-A-disaccharide synthase (EC [uncultured Campylobacterales bacterium]